MLYLTSIVALFTAGAKATCWQDEDLFCHCVYVSDALGVTDDWNLCLANSQRYGSSCILHREKKQKKYYLDVRICIKQQQQYIALTFAHVAVTSDGASLPRGVAYTPRRQAHQAHAVLEFGLPVQLQQGNVVVQSLAVVIVMNVRRCHPQRLSAGAAVLSR